MAGRGRGRGGAKWTPPSGARAFLMRSAEECGFDSRNLRSVQEVTRPSLFPDILLHSSGDQRILDLLEKEKAQAEADALHNGVLPIPEAPKKLSGVKRTLQAVYLIEKGVQIHNRIQNSVFYVRPSKNVPDAIRFSDSTRPPPQIDASAVLSSCLEGRKRTAMGRFVPEELVSGQIQIESGRLYSSIEAENAAINLTDFENKERQRTDGVEGQEDDEFEAGEEEEDDGADYVTNYYESDGEDSGGGDGEATF